MDGFWFFMFVVFGMSFVMCVLHGSTAQGIRAFFSIVNGIIFVAFPIGLFWFTYDDWLAKSFERTWLGTVPPILWIVIIVGSELLSRVLEEAGAVNWAKETIGKGKK